MIVMVVMVLIIRSARLPQQGSNIALLLRVQAEGGHKGVHDSIMRDIFQLLQSSFYRLLLYIVQFFSFLTCFD